VRIADGATIHAFCHIAGASIASGCSVGPFARLRPGAVMGEGAKVGNFVEMKQATLGEGRQDQSSELRRRRQRRRRGQHRRGHDHLQL
jgi:bifunctional N-acetylglucosamine-1-phosphate-uridyltransferase/glucosamine-1-phosphate-acetyltransferase GlmU-like protein